LAKYPRESLTGHYFPGLEVNVESRMMNAEFRRIVSLLPFGFRYSTFIFTSYLRSSPVAIGIAIVTAFFPITFRRHLLRPDSPVLVGFGIDIGIGFSFAIESQGS
jgi:hypothetical protein